MVEKIYQSVRTYFENLEAQQGAAAAESAEPAAGEPVAGIEGEEGELAAQQESAGEAQPVEPATASETARPAEDAAVAPAGGEESQPDKESERESEGETS
jgi:hypothetical protein